MMKPLGQRQLFTMRPASLIKRFKKFSTQSSEAGIDSSAYLIQCALIALIRNALSPEDFSVVAKELIGSLFLEGTNLEEVKSLCVYFRPFFTDDQWQKVIIRLFPTPEERSKITEQAHLYTEKFPLLYSGERDVDTKASLLSTFLDANGKKHSWTLSNVDPNLTSQQHEDYLSLLSTLTILQKDGVRRFVSLVEVNYSLFRSSVARRTQEEIAEQQATIDALPRVSTIRPAAPQPVEGTETSNKPEETHQSANAASKTADKQTSPDQSTKKKTSSTKIQPTKPDPVEELNDPESVANYLNQLKRKAAGNPPTREERKKQNQVNKVLGKKGKNRKKKNKRRK